MENTSLKYETNKKPILSHVIKYKKKYKKLAK